jgi:hypothetical protein
MEKKREIMLITLIWSVYIYICIEISQLYPINMQKHYMLIKKKK